MEEVHKCGVRQVMPKQGAQRTENFQEVALGFTPSRLKRRPSGVYSVLKDLCGRLSCGD